MENNEHLSNIRHTLAHLLAQASKEHYPNALLTLGPSIDNGFYYDIDFGTDKINVEDLEKIEKTMKKNLPLWKEFSHREISSDEAKEYFKENVYKLELIDEIVAKEEKITLYACGGFTDLCRGGHCEHPSKEIDIDSFHLDRVAGAYWRGDEKNKMLTRIYGLAFNTKEELNTYLTQQEEAKKRDHRKIGKELDLFHIDETVGLGLPLWHPKGAILWRTIEEFWYREHLKNDYELVRSPHIGNKMLWQTSGHWGFYNSSMYPPLEVGQTLEEKQQGEKVKISEEYLLKPMNCPFHVQIYKSSPKSYRELPFRWAECGTVYRFEKKGELSGLTRVRGFTQDDAHIICRADQVEEELVKVIDFILHIYKSFGFNLKDVNVYLSVRNPENQKYAGTNEGWEFTEKVLEKVAKEKKLTYQKDIGGAVFYGPKLDFKVKDAIGREWQCSTLQFDFNLPERFQMSFVNSKGEEEQPYMLHRALLGSYERFIGVLIEHYAGTFPLWISPVQVRILPISEEKHSSFAKEVWQTLKNSEIRVELDDSNESLGKRIRNAKMQKVPYIVVIGDKEKESNTITVEGRKEKLENIEVEKFLEKLQKEISEKTLS